jgi:hypothetical protein
MVVYTTAVEWVFCCAITDQKVLQPMLQLLVQKHTFSGFWNWAIINKGSYMQR